MHRLRQQRPAGNKKFQIVIDDASHLSDAIMLTLETFLPYLDWENGFVYFIEDNGSVIDDIAERFGHLFRIFMYRGQRGHVFPSDVMIVLEPRWHYGCE